MTDLDPSRCAVLVIDMQNDFSHPDGAMARMGHDTSATQAIVPNIDRLTAAARRADVPVVMVRTTHSHWYDTPAWLTRGLENQDSGASRQPLVREGTWGAEQYGVEVAESDLVLVKHRYSAFAYTPLELVLQAKGRDTVLLAGTRTHVCVAYTANDAISRGFHPVLVSDCTSDGTPEIHDRAVRDFDGHLGRPTTLERVEAAFAAGGAAG